MAYPRSMLVSLQSTSHYHVVSRCVRRAWLWGVDKYTGKDYSHRKTWVLERLKELCEVFSIEILGFSVLSNHYHLIAWVDLASARGWSDVEVVERWSRLFRKPVLIERWLNGSACEAERDAAKRIIREWRSRLQDLSWFVRCLNEHLARRANAEDGCRGRFWEGRFKSQALLDERGLLTAMAYVDLNPIRAGIAPTPEKSDFTSVQARIRQAIADSAASTPAIAAVSLQPFRDQAPEPQPAIPFRFADYLELVDWSGRAIRGEKRGAIDESVPPLLQRLNIDRDAWQKLMQPKGNGFGRAIGKLDRLMLYATALGKRYLRGRQQAEYLYGGLSVDSTA